LKQLQKKLNEVSTQLREEQQKLRDREEDLKKMQEDYDSKIRELQATLFNEQQHKEELEKQLEDQATLITEHTKQHEARVEYVLQFTF
jgi:hypothetical protein